MGAKYKPGDPVRDIRCDVIPGKFVDLQGQTATVRWEGKLVYSEIWIDNLRPETAEETAKRERIKAWRAWSAMQPKASHVGVRWDHTTVYVDDMTDPDKMRQAAAELIRFADWFAERPVRP